MMFFMRQIGKERIAIAWGQDTVENAPDKPMGAEVHLMRYNATKNSSFPAQKKNRVR
jgi:hypothetical protein